jgi:hypothetical protein
MYYAMSYDPIAPLQIRFESQRLDLESKIKSQVELFREHYRSIIDPIAKIDEKVVVASKESIFKLDPKLSTKDIAKAYESICSGGQVYNAERGFEWAPAPIVSFKNKQFNFLFLKSSDYSSYSKGLEILRDQIRSKLLNNKVPNNKIGDYAEAAAALEILCEEWSYAGFNPHFKVNSSHPASDWQHAMARSPNDPKYITTQLLRSQADLAALPFQQHEAETQEAIDDNKKRLTSDATHHTNKVKQGRGSGRTTGRE